MKQDEPKTADGGKQPGHKPADRATEERVNALLPEALKAKLARPDPLAAAPPAPRALPPRQPLPRAKVEPAKPRLQLGLDVHLEFIMAVVQRGHASLQAPGI